jgi:DNA-binding NtrC family response regulator
MAGRILLVDDDPTTRRSLSRVLSLEGCSVENVDNGKTALSLIESGIFDAVLSDLHLGGGIDGLGLLDRSISFSPRNKIQALEDIQGRGVRLKVRIGAYVLIEADCAMRLINFQKTTFPERLRSTPCRLPSQ